MPVATVIKIHGGKAYLARRIVALMPKHIHYVEPYAGGLSVLLAKNPKNISEVVNDIDGDLTNFWLVLQCPQLFAGLLRTLQATPFSQYEFDRAEKGLNGESATYDQVDRAVKFFILCRQSLAGRRSSFTGVTKARTRRGMNNEVSAWLSSIEGLPEVHERLKRVLILNRSALEVIKGQDSTNTLFYCDPPYVCSTRVSPRIYKYEMSLKQHYDLLKLLQTCCAKVMISGYSCKLYNDVLSNWTRHTFEVPNHASSSRRKRIMVESLWCNW